MRLPSVLLALPALMVRASEAPVAPSRLAAPLCAALLWVSACAGDGASGPPRMDDPLPEFSAPLLDGDTVSLAEYRGGPVLVNLWATWCAPCREEMPYLESVGRDYAEAGLRVVGISTDHAGALDQVRNVLAERGVTYDVLLDTDARSTDLFGALGLPVTFLANDEGVVTWMRLGPILEGDPSFLAALDAVTADRGGAP